ncbi:MAG: hypothetical protein AAF721_11485 [Myxococcota bacterium]
MSEPSDDRVHRIHDRYLTEVVEGLRLCPFARHSREQGRVHRPVLRCDGDTPSPEQAAHALIDVATAHADAEIVLITFIGDDPRMATAPAFDEFVRDVRDALSAANAPRPFFMVGFHRDSGQVPAGEPPPRLTPDSLVPLLRRTPDPVIQCVDTRTLEQARATAQHAAHERMIAELSALDPALRVIAERSVAADSELSADIARANFEAVAAGDGRAELERRIAEIIAERDANG